MDIPALINNNKTLILIGVAAIAAIVLMKKLRNGGEPLNTAVVVKGSSKLALGVGLWGIVMALDSMDVLPNDTYGKVTKYMGLAAGALYAARGAMTILNGSE